MYWLIIYSYNFLTINFHIFENIKKYCIQNIFANKFLSPTMIFMKIFILNYAHVIFIFDVILKQIFLINIIHAIKYYIIIY
jgi:hypothetical protein